MIISLAKVIRDSKATIPIKWIIAITQRPRRSGAGGFGGDFFGGVLEAWMGSPVFVRIFRCIGRFFQISSMDAVEDDLQADQQHGGEERESHFEEFEEDFQSESCGAGRFSLVKRKTSSGSKADELALFMRNLLACPAFRNMFNVIKLATSCHKVEHSRR